MTPKEYLQSLVWPRFVLLGEIHDNPDHHILQGLAIRSLGGGRPTVVFEHFQTGQQSMIDAFQTSLEADGEGTGANGADRLFLVTSWAKSGWPKQELFRPLIDAVIERRARIIAGNPPRARVRKVARSGFDAVSQDAQRRLLLDTPLGDDLRGSLLDELEASHCGLLPRSAFGGMVVAQRLRDGHMARAMADAAARGKGQVALVAGAGHVRLDSGVPWYLKRMIPAPDERSSVSVGHFEVAEGKHQPSDYMPELARYSLVVFTPRAARKDPCVEMRKRFRAPKKK